MKVLAGILIVAVGALAWALFSLNSVRRQMAALQQTNEITILDYSNRLAFTRQQLDEQKKVNAVLETNVTDRTRQLETLRTELEGLTTDLAKSRAETKSVQDTLKVEVSKRDNQISSLETRNVDLTKQMGDLQSTIAGLEKQISETERRLASSEGNRQEILKELKRLQDEKIGLEKQLHDLVFLREQVRKLKDELTVARRLEWIRHGIYGTAGTKKGAEILNELKFGEPRDTSSTGLRARTPSPSLDVELKRSGEVKVQGAAPTNAPSGPR